MAGFEDAEQEDFAYDIGRSLVSMLGYGADIPASNYARLGKAILDNPKFSDAWIDVIDQYDAPQNMSQYTTKMVDNGKDYLINDALMGQRNDRKMTAFKSKELPSEIQNLALAAVLGASYNGELPERLKGTEFAKNWEAIKQALGNTKYYKRMGFFASSSAPVRI